MSLVVASLLVAPITLPAADGFAIDPCAGYGVPLEPCEGPSDEPVRVLAHTPAEITAARVHGCEHVRDARTVHAFVCPARVAQALGLPADLQLHLLDTDANAQVGADIVHANGVTGEGRRVVVLDTGIDYTHPALESSYAGGYDFVNNDDDPLDDHGHGTHVAGIITADGKIAPGGVFESDAARGIAPDADIIAGKVVDENGEGFLSDVLAAIYWGVNGPDGQYGTDDDFEADAISMSLGTPPPLTYHAYCDGVPLFRDFMLAVGYATDRGVPVVAAAGNSNLFGVSMPGCLREVVTVAAVHRSDATAGFSSRGVPVDISAPGVNIYSTIPGGYGPSSGTSMATPMVSGTLALIGEEHPEYTYEARLDVLLRTTEDLGEPSRDPIYGWGRVNASAAVAEEPQSPCLLYCSL